MILYYVRHADPIYDPDSLTPLGERQAEAVGKRLAMHGVDRIYASTSNRAIMTAKPLAEMVKKEIELCDFANECYAAEEFMVERNGRKEWAFDDEEYRTLFADGEVLSLGSRWYEHPKLARFKSGADRVSNVAYEFIANLGYEHIEGTGRYKVVRGSDERVALFAHGGFGMAFLSAVLNIPYPIFANNFAMCHTGITAIEFGNSNGYAIPRTLTLSSGSHLYKEGLPTKYNNRIYI